MAVVRRRRRRSGEGTADDAAATAAAAAAAGLEEEGAVEAGNQVLCAAGHSMELLTLKPASYKGRVACDICRARRAPRSPFFHCAVCSFDKCCGCAGAGKAARLLHASLDEELDRLDQMPKSLEILLAISSACGPAANLLEDLREALIADPRAALLCRHHGSIRVVISHWWEYPQEEKVAAAAASVLLLMYLAQAKDLREAGVDALCAEALRKFGASAVMAPVGKLWRKICTPPVRELMALMSHPAGCAETMRPLLRCLSSRKEVEDLSELEWRPALEPLLAGDLMQEAMGFLCKLAKPIEAPPCSRGMAGGEDDKGGSESEDGSDEEMEVARSLAKRSRTDSSMTTATEPCGDDDAPEAESPQDSCTAAGRATGIEQVLALQCPEPVSDEPHNGVAQEAVPCLPSAADVVSRELRAHLAIDVEATKSWPTIFPDTHMQCVAGGSSSSSSTPRFHADFEGANLRRVRLDEDGSLELLLKGDTNKSSHCQWFFFDVEVERTCELRFRVVTMAKPGSTFSQGQKVVTLSLQSTERRWRRDGHDYAYFPNRYSLGGRRGHYTLAFSLQLQVGRTRIASSYPYLFADFLRDLRLLRPSGDWLQAQRLGQTPSGRHPLLMLTITDFAAEVEVRQGRPLVVLVSRTHPAEAPSSFVLRGMLQLLLAQSAEAAALRENFVFLVFPMLNPDGVADGNGRANSQGADLNRCWENPPVGSEVAIVKQEILNQHRVYGRILTWLDLHAHSRRHGAFTLSNPGGAVLPDLLAKSTEETQSLFDRSQCTFRYTQAKRGSGRCMAWKELGVTNAHTIEATYAGLPDRSRLSTPADLEDLGREFVRACLVLETQCAAEGGPKEGTPKRGTPKKRRQRAAAAA
eukprot:TRINITY_DN22328_c0_g2_i2.p1 TRINITY_DN22328_c0_g2~~TRINITY_DN22328_c0_g2_i2.p1  ORF type:complete len:867 (-),score=182.95 TRINITY_DN22328_c0_g2_i2:69-2669(-)